MVLRSQAAWYNDAMEQNTEIGPQSYAVGGVVETFVPRTVGEVGTTRGQVEGKEFIYHITFA